MKPHTKRYMKACGYDISDFIPSELSGAKAVDIHHIIGRGKGGPDCIENLMALTREEHQNFGDKIQHMVFLFDMHEQFLQSGKIEYDYELLNDLKKKYVHIG